MLFSKIVDKLKNNKAKARSNILFFALNVCFMTFSLFGISLINSYHNPNELDYIANAISVNNKNNRQEMSFWQITPDIDYYGNWFHWQFDETMYSISEFYTTRGFANHNHTFMINYSSNEEIFYSDSNSTHYISIITSPSRVGFKSLGLSFLNDYQPDYKNEFYISEALYNNLNKENGSIDLSICSSPKTIDYSGVVKTVSNSTVKKLVGDEFIVIPYKYAFEIKEYTGHTSFVLCLRNDYYENYAFSRVIKHAFNGIEKGSKYNAYFHDSASTLSTPFVKPNSALQTTYDDYVEHILGLAITGYLITFSAIASILLFNLLVVFKKRKPNIYYEIFCAFCSFALYTLISSIMRTIGIVWFFPWSFVSRIIVALVCTLYILLFLALHQVFRKKYHRYFISNDDFYECNI